MTQTDIIKQYYNIPDKGDMSQSEYKKLLIKKHNQLTVERTEMFEALSSQFDVIAEKLTEIKGLREIASMQTDAIQSIQDELISIEEGS